MIKVKTIAAPPDWIVVHRKEILAVILLIACGLRFWGIEWGIPAKENNYNFYHPDECYIMVAVNNIKIFDGKLYPGFQWALENCSGSLEVFSLINDVAGIAPSVYEPQVVTYSRQMKIDRRANALLSVLAVLVLYLAGRRVYGTRIGLLAAFFLAILPVDVYAAHNLKPDVIATLLTIVTFYYVVRISDDDKMKHWLVAGLFSGLAASAKYTAIYSTLMIFIVYLQKVNFRNRDLLKRYTRRLSFSALSCIVGFIIGNPSAIIKTDVFLKTTKTMQWFQHDFFAGIGMTHFYTAPVLEVFYGWGAPLLLCILLSVIIFVFMPWRKTSTVISAYILFWTAFLLKASNFVAVHWLCLVSPFIMLVVSNACFYKLKYRMAETAKNTLMASAAVITFFYAASYVSLFTGPDQRTEAKDWIEKNIPKNQKIAILTGWADFGIASCNPPLTPEKNTVQFMGSYTFPGPADNVFYIVTEEVNLTDYRYMEVSPEYADRFRFFDDLKAQKDYTLIKTFSKYPRLFGLEYKFPTMVTDWHVPEIAVYIYEKKGINRFAIDKSLKGKKAQIR